MTEKMTVCLPGLDGSNPLGFLAALGLLRVLDHQARLHSTTRPMLSWIEDGIWYPKIHGLHDLKSVIEWVMGDLASWAQDPAFTLAYDEAGQNLVDVSDPLAIRDLKPKPKAMRMFLSRVAALTDTPDDRANVQSYHCAKRAMETAAAFGSELVQDRTKGNTKPLAFHFAAGQQSFLEAAEKLREGLTESDLTEALLGPWTGASKLPSMSWDATVSRNYALRASDPSAEKRGSTPGADWLAFASLGLFLVTPMQGELRTAGVRGGWKDSAFTWVLWDGPLNTSVIRSVLAMSQPQKLSIAQRHARGISVVFSSGIMRSDQGGYGSFSPARVC